jgi:hypothetical protein
MKNFLIIILIGSTILHSCKNEKPSSTTPEQKEIRNYFPVAGFLKGQIHYADSLPSAMLKLATKNNKSDSVYISRSEFDNLAHDFIFPELEQNIFEKEFKESSFVDQTTQSAIFTYSSDNNKLQLQRVDVLATPDELYSKVKSIFMQAAINKNDTIIVKKLYWQANKYFQVSTITMLPNQSKIISQVKVVWDAGE